MIWDTITGTHEIMKIINPISFGKSLHHCMLPLFLNLSEDEALENPCIIVPKFNHLI
jgi:hypothetical protein